MSLYFGYVSLVDGHCVSVSLSAVEHESRRESVAIQCTDRLAKEIIHSNYNYYIKDKES